MNPKEQHTLRKMFDLTTRRFAPGYRAAKRRVTLLDRPELIMSLQSLFGIPPNAAELTIDELRTELAYQIDQEFEIQPNHYHLYPDAEFFLAL